MFCCHKRCASPFPPSLVFLRCHQPVHDQAEKGALRCAGQTPVTVLDVVKFRASLSSPFILESKVTYQDSVVLISDGLSAGPDPLYVLPTPACAQAPPAFD